MAPWIPPGSGPPFHRQIWLTQQEEAASVGMAAAIAEQGRTTIERTLTHIGLAPAQAGPGLAEWISSCAHHSRAHESEVVQALTSLVDEDLCAYVAPLFRPVAPPGCRQADADSAFKKLYHGNALGVSVKSVVYALMERGVLRAFADLAVPRPNLQRAGIQIAALAFLHDFAESSLDKASPASPELEAYCNAQPLLAPSVRELVAGGVARVMPDW